MKKNNKIYNICITAIFSSMLVLTGCYDDGSDGFSGQEAVAFDITPKSISTFDEDIEFSITSDSTSDIQVGTLELYKSNEFDNLISEAALTNNEGTFITTSSDIGLEEIDDSVFLDLVYEADNINPKSTHEITMYNPVEASISNTELEYLTTVADTLSYTTSTEFATIDNIIIEQKKLYTGTFEEITPTDTSWPIDEGSYIFSASEYPEIMNDTLYFKVTAFSNGLIATSDTLKVFIKEIEEED